MSIFFWLSRVEFCLKLLFLVKNEEALAEFRELKSPSAAFYMAQIYKQLALKEDTDSKVP
jgi:hypothetical protein